MSQRLAGLAVRQHARASRRHQIGRNHCFSSITSSSPSSSFASFGKEAKSFVVKQQQHQVNVWSTNLHQNTKRFLFTSQDRTYGPHDFPKEKTPPKVSHITAAEAQKLPLPNRDEERLQKISGQEQIGNVENPASLDVFDDGRTFSSLEVDRILESQRQYLPKNLSSLKEFQSIETIPPPSITAQQVYTTTSQLYSPGENDQTFAPQTTVLSNGLQVISQSFASSNPHPCATIGLVARMGIRYATKPGVPQLAETLAAFSSTPTLPNGLEVNEQLMEWGISSASGGTPAIQVVERDVSLWCLDMLWPNVGRGFGLLASSMLEPQWNEDMLEEVKATLQMMNANQDDFIDPTIQILDFLHQAAYGEDQQLGRTKMCSPEDIAKLTLQDLQDFIRTYIWENPRGLVVSAAGLEHDKVVQMAQEHFGHLKQGTAEKDVGFQSCEYRGGYVHHVKQLSPMHLPEEQPQAEGTAATKQHQQSSSREVEAQWKWDNPDSGSSQEDEEESEQEKDRKMTHVAIGLEFPGGVHSKDLVALFVIKFLLGGGDHFSAGGPGKGMYTKFYRRILNRYHFVKAAKVEVQVYAETGLLILLGKAPPAKGVHLTHILAEEYFNLATHTHELFNAQELERAKNMLKSFALSSVESRIVLFEDMARQMLEYGRRETQEETCNRIDAVTMEDVHRVLKQTLDKPPSLAVVGIEEAVVPTYEQVTKWMS